MSFTGGLADGHGHGTHVGGIIAGDSSLGYTPDPVTGYGQALLDGMAPKAFLFGYKVLTDPGNGAGASIVLAIDTAVADGAHVLNLSLGSTADDPSDPECDSIANGMAAGHVVAVAAGNSGPAYSTIGTPATCQEALTVGSSTDPGNNKYYVNDRADNQRFQMNLMANSPAPPTANPIEAHYVYVGEGCAPTDYALKAPVSGRIALIKRGTCTFTVKKELAQANGAAAAIIFNNVSGNFSGTMTRSTIVVGALSDVDGNHLAGHTDATTGLSSHTLQFDPNYDSLVGQVSGFSSRGPTDDYRIKPDIVAPGDSITSAVPRATQPLAMGDPSGYADAGGTSMATPHMAGASALMRQAHPGWTAREIKAAFMNTARQLTDPADGKPYSIMDQGAGLVDVQAALTAPAVIVDPSHSFQVVQTGGGTKTVAHRFAILDKSGAGGTWSLAWHDGDGKNRNGQGRALPAAGWSQSFSSTSVSVPANGSASFTFSVTIDGSVLAEGDYEGHIVATNGTSTLRVPIFARHEKGPISGITAPVLDDPGTTDADGSYALSWSNISGEAGYRVQQATSVATAFSDNANDSLTGKWTTQAAPNGWTRTDTNANSPCCSYWSLNSDDRNAMLTLKKAIKVPAGSEASVTFASYEDTEPTYDFGYVEASDDGGASWVTLLTLDGWSGGWVQRRADLTGLSGDVLVRFRYATDGLISAPLYLGWYVDDISIAVSNWTTSGSTVADATTYSVANQPDGTYYHRVAGLFDRGGSQPILGPWSNVVDITVARPAQPDLQVASIVVNNNKSVRQGDKVTVAATIKNAGNASAGASSTKFELVEAGQVLGTASTPALAPGAQTTVSVQWDTRSVRGTYTIRVTADSAANVSESNEANNVGTTSVTVQGNKGK